MNESRYKILCHIKRHGQATIAELARVLGLTTVTIRHHLQILREMELLEKPNPKPRSGPGRPEMVYRLTKRADKHLPRNYDQLSLALVDVLSRSPKPDSLAQLFLLAGHEVGQQAELEQKAQAEQHVKDVCLWLESRGYFLSCETKRNLLHIRIRHCPYLEIAQRHKAICAFDQGLLGRLFEAPVRVAKRIAVGDEECILRVSLPGLN
jgi:predicted ArsR family transcriptional regulator